jgi:hypothetical protein
VLSGLKRALAYAAGSGFYYGFFFHLGAFPARSAGNRAIRSNLRRRAAAAQIPLLSLASMSMIKVKQLFSTFHDFFVFLKTPVMFRAYYYKCGYNIRKTLRGGNLWYR